MRRQPCIGCERTVEEGPSHGINLGRYIRLAVCTHCENQLIARTHEVEQALREVLRR